MKIQYILFSYAFVLFASPAEALVAQSASSALRNDVFVDTSSSSSGRSSYSSSSKQADRKKQIEEAKKKRKAAHEKFLNQKSNDKGNVSATTKTESVATSASSTSSDTHNATEYQKKLASRFQKAISGYITIEQKNLPKRIVISRDAVVQLELDAQADAFWYVQLNEDALSVQKNEVEDGKTVVVLNPVGKGASKVILDFISQSGTEHKVLATKKFNIVVSE